jgi:hypothetical protein
MLASGRNQSPNEPGPEGYGLFLKSDFIGFQKAPKGPCMKADLAGFIADSPKTIPPGSGLKTSTHRAKKFQFKALSNGCATTRSRKYNDRRY